MPSRMPVATSRATTCGVAVLLVVGAVAVAVLEVDAEVLDRLARAASRRRAARRLRVRSSGEPDRARERDRVGAVLVEDAARASSPSLRAVSALNRCAPP